MNILRQALKIPGGILHVKDWLGSGGEVVNQERAQSRADCCQKCDFNKPLMGVTEAVAAAIKEQLEFKNKLKLNVAGEESLRGCHKCGCDLKLQIWEPQVRVVAHLTQAEIEDLPDHCWKLSDETP